MKKKSVLRLLSGFIVLLLFYIGQHKLSNIVSRKDSFIRFAEFHNQKANFDVLFLGTSHVRNAIFPMELWKDYGIISYNLGGSGNPFAITYWQLINALDYFSPSLIVLDCAFLSVDAKYRHFNIGNYHSFLDSFPISANKLKMVFDLFESTHRKVEFIFTYVTYHDRWKKLGKNDFIVPVGREKGAETRIGIAAPKRDLKIPATKKYEGNSLSVKYLEKILSLCAARNIEVLLTYYPFPAKENEILESHRVFEIAQKYKLDYLSYEELKALVDFDIDCFDSNSHLNPSGARKITRFLGQYVHNHYNISDHRNDPKYASWHKEYQEYTQFKIGTIRNQKSLKNTLMLLSDRNFSYAVYFPNDRLYQNKIIMKLLRNTGADMEQIYFQSPNLIVIDNKKKKVRYCKVAENANSSFGKLSVKKINDGSVFALNGQKILEVKNGEKLEAAVIVFDNDSGKRVAAQKYQAL